MMEHFVTVLNSTFLPQGLILHSSLQRHCEGSVLWVICVDQLACDVISERNDPTLNPIAAAEFEDDVLVALRRTRTIGEYCWTLTPIAPRIVLERQPDAHRVTYLDADMYALASPAPIFRELERSGKSVLITEHGYSPERDMSALSGKYCVQFVTFVRGESERVRSWWEARCIEWCFNRFEDGRFGDQKYLDDWPERFPNEVYVLERREMMLAPWNATRFPVSEGIFYHFHQVRTARRGRFEVGSYPVPGPLWQAAYLPYLTLLDHVWRELIVAGRSVQPQVKRASLGRRLKRVLRSFRRT